MPKLPSTEQQHVDETLIHLLSALRSVINGMHSVSHTDPSWSIFQRESHNIAKAHQQMEDDVKNYECECQSHRKLKQKQTRCLDGTEMMSKKKCK
jgi:hypothetical protein